MSFPSTGALLAISSDVGAGIPHISSHTVGGKVEPSEVTLTGPSGPARLVAGRQAPGLFRRGATAITTFTYPLLGRRGNPTDHAAGLDDGPEYLADGRYDLLQFGPLRTNADLCMKTDGSEREAGH